MTPLFHAVLWKTKSKPMFSPRSRAARFSRPRVPPLTGMAADSIGRSDRPPNLLVGPSVSLNRLRTRTWRAASSSAARMSFETDFSRSLVSFTKLSLVK